MPSVRVEAFSDAVIAILITIMVLELHLPAEPTFSSLRHLWPTFLTYILSFMYLGIYWNNHHHMFQLVEEVSGGVLWANLHLLFWLSLVPFFTAWMGSSDFATTPTVAYGCILLADAIAYFLLQRTLVKQQGSDGVLARAIGRDVKGKISPIIYLIAIPLTFVNEWIGFALYLVVAAMWIVPDSRVEAVLTEK